MAEQAVFISLWHNDERRFLGERAASMLDKRSERASLRWTWIVGDSEDDTELRLRDIAQASGKDVTVLRNDSGIVGNDSATRRRRQSVTFNAGLDALRPEDTHVVHHESDLSSPADIVDRLLESGHCPVAGWPVLPIENPPLFYDIWAYRGMDGQHFDNRYPYHRDYRPDQPFRVQSAGSVLMYHATDIREGGIRCYERGVVELCERFAAIGRSVWVLPTVIIVQPPATWTPCEF